MKRILLFGAGKSAICLIDYLGKELKQNDWRLAVCDADLGLAQRKIQGIEHAEAVLMDVADAQAREELIRNADIVISMLPPALHFVIAKDCVAFGRNLLTASYVDENIRLLEPEIAAKKLLFLCEMGLDPGIDHMSAMKMIHTIQEKGGKIDSFISHCGGLIAPECDNNPWHYKVTWNPRNIVLAGHDGAEYLEDQTSIAVPYRQIFMDCPPVAIVENYPLCWYPNRDSLHYVELYGLEGIATFIRTTLRHPAFCRGWKKIVEMGLTDTGDFKQVKECKTFQDWYDVKVTHFTGDKRGQNDNPQENIDSTFRNEFRTQVEFLGLQSDEPLPMDFLCSADILQFLVEKKLAIAADDKDMIVMLHEMRYRLGDEKYEVKSSLIVKGDDSLRTAMAKTVGLPLGIATKLILQEKIQTTGLHIPVIAEIYEPVLEVLKENGIVFHNQVSPIISS